MNSYSLTCCLLAAACAGAPDSTATPDPFAEVRRNAEACRDRGDLDAALTVLDGAGSEFRDQARYQALRGELTLQLAVESRDAGRRGAGLLFVDAVDALRKTIELDATAAAPRRLLTQALLETGQVEEAVAVATAEVARPAPSPAAGADLPTPAGNHAEAVLVFARAARAEPENHAVLDALVETAAALQELPLALDTLLPRRDAVGCWYQGRAHYLHADAIRTKRGPTAAIAAVDEARQCFAAAKAANADYRDACEQWLAMCLGKKGNLAFEVGDFANAEAWLLEAAALRPGDIEVALGAGETVKLGLLRLGDRLMRDTKRTEALFHAAAEVATSDVDLLNNAAVYARDLGIKRARAGDSLGAKAMFERSYDHYRRAVQVDPASVRLRNDCALVAIHYIGGDWDAAKAMLDAAIADGERQMHDDPPRDTRGLQDLDEAIGDAYENLALWHLKHGKDARAARAAAQQSLQHHPRDKRAGANRHLQDAEQLAAGR